MNEERIKKYIQEQETADISLGKLSVKEYEDPCRDSNLVNNPLPFLRVAKAAKTKWLERSES